MHELKANPKQTANPRKRKEREGMNKAPGVFDAKGEYRDYLRQTVAIMVSGEDYLLRSHTSFIKQGKTHPHRHINEAVIYWVSGKGYSTVQPVGEDKETKVEWEAGSVVFVPSFARHGHVVASDEARFIAVTARGSRLMDLYKEALFSDDKRLIEKLRLGVSSLAQFREIAAREWNIVDRDIFAFPFVGEKKD